MTLVILAAEIDISVGSAMALYSALLGVLPAFAGWSLWAAVLAVLVLGAAVGGLAGYIRDRFNIPSFIVTLALLSALRGVALYLTDASPIAISDDAFAFLGGGRIVSIPVPVIIFVLLFFVFWFIAEKTTFGRAVYAVGGNPEAAKISGISLTRVRIAIFAITGLLSAVSAIMLSSLIRSGNAGLGDGAEFQVIAAVIVGGTSLFGGRGSMTGTLLGVLFVGLLNNGMVLIGANQYIQQMAQGLIILVAVLLSESLRGGGLSAGLSRIVGGLSGRRQ
jgi:simple sugar transport system permease protein